MLLSSKVKIGPFSELCNFTLFTPVVVHIEAQLNCFAVKTLFGHEAHRNLAFVQAEYVWTKVVDVAVLQQAKVSKAFC